MKETNKRLPQLLFETSKPRMCEPKFLLYLTVSFMNSKHSDKGTFLVNQCYKYNP